MPGKIFAGPYFSGLRGYVDTAFHVCINVQRYCPVPACIYIPSDKERAGSGKAAAYTGFLLGICTDEPASGIALEYGTGAVSKKE